MHQIAVTQHQRTFVRQISQNPLHGHRPKGGHRGGLGQSGVKRRLGPGAADLTLRDFGRVAHHQDKPKPKTGHRDGLPPERQQHADARVFQHGRSLAGKSGLQQSGGLGQPGAQFRQPRGNRTGMQAPIVPGRPESRQKPVIESAKIGMLVKPFRVFGRHKIGEPTALETHRHHRRCQNRGSRTMDT